jgi:hypothetical protein
VTLPDFDYKKSVSATATTSGRRGTEGGGHESTERGRGRRGHGESRGPSTHGRSSGAQPGSVRAAGAEGGELSHGRRPQRNAPNRRRRKM